MATKLTNPVKRETIGTLDGSFGCDRGKNLIAIMSVGDVLVIKPKRSQRQETISLFDVYRYAIRCRVNKEHMEKMRNKKQAKAVKRLAAKIRREDRKFKKPLTNVIEFKKAA